MAESRRSQAPPDPHPPAEHLQKGARTGGELWFKTDNTDLYLATQRYLAEASFEILCKTDDLHSEDAPGNIQSEHEVMFTAEGIKTKAIIARWNGEPETPERVSTEQAEKVENTAE